MSVEEKVIEEYAVSPNNSSLAVVVPVGRYYPEEGMVRSRIRVLDMETKDTIVQLPEASSSYFDSLPWGLEWITDTKLLFRQRDSIVLWDITAKEADIFSVPYGRFSASHYSGEIALWQISNDRNFQLSVDVNIYSYPDGIKTKTISINENVPIEIVDVVWSSDDKFILVITTLSKDSEGYIYRIDLSTENVTKLATIDSLLLPSDEIAWNSVDDWIAIDSAGGIRLFSLTKQCFFEEYRGSFSEPLWANSTLFALNSFQTIVELKLDNSVNDKMSCLSS